MTLISRAIPALAAAAILSASAVPASAPAFAKSNYDGQWSVLIVTQKGTCDRAYRYPVKIENGSVGYAGEASFNVSGKVGPNGADDRHGLAAADKSAKGHRPDVGDRRRGHLDRGFGRMFRHLDGRAPLFLSLIGPENRVPAPADALTLTFLSRFLEPGGLRRVLALGHPGIHLRNKPAKARHRRNKRQHPAETGVG